MTEENKNPKPQLAGKSKIAEREEEILKFWQENKIFEKSLEKPSPKGEFVFYDGPVTSNTKPVFHTMEPFSFKDIIPRYRTMRGYHVGRKGGWDTHGLPVELQVEKKLGFKSKKDIENYGIAAFNKLCKDSVWEYIELWKNFTSRIGYWADQEHAYVTYDNSYIEAVWSILKKVNERNLIYKDYKVVPWCPRCGTGLSSHELAQGYEDVKENSIYLKFKIASDNPRWKDTYVLAWTTTPWTLPGNIALAVGEDIDYVKIKVGEEFFILAKARLAVINGEYEIVGEMKGKDLIGLGYEPLFPYLENNVPNSEKDKMRNAHKIYPANFVTTEDGTGIVHTAVMYGQEDFELGNKIGLPKIHMVNNDGRFKEKMGFLSGRFVKEKDEKGKPTLDVDILNYLKEKNFYFSDKPYTHSYPFCWRCHTPLIYYARDSWYIKMSSLHETLVKENEGINWVPAHIKEGRFGEWLREVKDWAISRERYWGTPLPIWQDERGKNFVAGNINELKKHTKKSSNKYFVMRHGEAELNLEDLINSDPKNVYHLTDEGKKQVKMTAEDLKSKKIDFILASPFTRCKETAEIVRKTIGLDENNLIVNNELWEFKKGSELEGKKWQAYYDLFENTEEKFKKSAKGGENLSELKKRMGDFIYNLEKKYSGKNILMVGHRGPIECMFMVAEGADIKISVEMKDSGEYELNYAELREVDFIPLPHNENYELDLHKPFIDEVILVDEKGNELKRVKEVMDVWFDSGGMPFAQNGLKPLKEIQYPADFISEAIDQTRGWFYTLHAIGVLMEKGKAFKNVICLGHVLDSKGKKMSKSLGNIVDPWLMIDKYGADALRMWMYTVNQPGDSKNFDEKTVDEVVKKVFNLAENILSFYNLYKDEGIKPNNKSKHILDRWIINKTNSLIHEGGGHLESFKVFEAARLIRDFVNDFSTWYIRRSRGRFKSENAKDKNDALATTHFVLLEMAKYIAPFMPFFAEYMYLKLKSENDPESVHLCEWPVMTEKIDEEVLKNMEEARKIVSLALEKRMVAGIKVRQPLNELRIKNYELRGKEKYLDLIKDEVNVKNISFNEKLETEVELNTEITPELQKEGSIRGLVRAIQELRKNKNLVPSDVIELLVETDNGGKEFLNSVLEKIRRPTNVSEIRFEKNEGSEIKIGDFIFIISLA